MGESLGRWRGENSEDSKAKCYRSPEPKKKRKRRGAAGSPAAHDEVGVAHDGPGMGALGVVDVGGEVGGVVAGARARAVGVAFQRRQRNDEECHPQTTTLLARVSLLAFLHSIKVILES